jgi:photosystem II stability/assembly factor-like uncharacterized protein
MFRFRRFVPFAGAAGGLIVASSAAFAAIDPDKLHGLAPRSIGPAGMSGRIAAIDAVESDPDTVYVGAATGGIWKSTNGGITWKPVFDDQPVAAIGALAIDPSNPSVVWAGTGEGNVRNSASVGNGVYRSVDGGESWRHVGLDGTERIHRIVVHPRDSDTVWVAALGREWGENPERGIFKTIDGGKSWRKVLYVDEKTGGADVALVPGHPDKLFAAMWQYRRWPYEFRSGGPGSGLHVSHDGGESWKRLEAEDGLPEGELGRIGIGVSRSNPAVVYALVEAKKSALLRSDDGGRSFRTVNSEPGVNPRPFYFCELRVDPTNADRLYSLDYTVRVSNDGGKTLRTLVRWDEIHGDHHALWIDPAQPEHLYIGNDGGVAVSRDGGRSNLFVANLPLAQFYHVAYDLDEPYNVYGGLQDNGSWRGPSSVRQRGGIRNHFWKNVGGGDGFETLPDPADSMQGYAMWQGGNLFRWNLRTGESKDVKPAPKEGEVLRFNWNAGLAQDPFDAGTIYLGSQYLHRSTDRGENWVTISPDLSSAKPEWWRSQQSGGITPDVSGAENFTTIITIEPSKKERGLIWVGTDDGRIQVTRDGGANWTSVEKNAVGVPADTWVPAIHASEHAAGTAFAVFDNHRRSDWKPYVYRTDDFGRSWRSIATPQLRGYALAIVQDPVDPDLLFLGTEFGLWLSLDGGLDWTRWTHGFPTVSVMDLAIHPRTHDLIVATHGRSIWIVDDITPLRGLDRAALDDPLRALPARAAAPHWRAPEDGGFGFGAGEFRGANRPYGAAIDFVANGDDLPIADERREKARKLAARRAGTTAAETRAKEAEKPKASIEIRDASGAVVRRLEVEAKRGLNRVVWDLGRDAFRSPPPSPEDEPDPNPSGPQVPPGRYDVVVKLADRNVTTAVELAAPAGSNNDAAAWRSRWEAILELGRLRDATVEVIERVRGARSDLEAIAAREKQARAADLRDRKVKAHDLPLAQAAKPIHERLDAIERRFWWPPESVGITPDTDVWTKLAYVEGYLTSTWDPPSAAHRDYLRQARLALASALEEWNAFEVGEIAGYRQRVEAERIELLPVRAPVSLD